LAHSWALSRDGSGLAHSWALSRAIFTFGLAVGRGNSHVREANGTFVAAVTALIIFVIFFLVSPTITVIAAAVGVTVIIVIVVITVVGVGGRQASSGGRRLSGLRGLVAAIRLSRGVVAGIVV